MSSKTITGCPAHNSPAQDLRGIAPPMQTGYSAQDPILASTNNPPDILNQLQCPLCLTIVSAQTASYTGSWPSEIKCPCCIMDTPLAPSQLKPAPPLIQTLLMDIAVHCQQTCGKEIRAGEYSTHKCTEEPGPSDADMQTACHTGFHQLSTDLLREKGAESIHTKLNFLQRTYHSVHDPVRRLSLIMKEHLLPIGAQNVAAIPPPDTFKFTIFKQYASLAQK